MRGLRMTRVSGKRVLRHGLCLLIAGIFIFSLTLMFSRSEGHENLHVEERLRTRSKRSDDSGPEDHRDVYQQLEHALSPQNVRTDVCRSVIFPGGRCQCVDVLQGVNADECEFAPVMDGKKTVCLDVLRPGEPCLVYSFGVRDDVSFETEMVKFGCEVHAFDPTVRVNETAMKALGINMHYIGVDGSSWIAYMDVIGEMKMMTLDDIVAHLGHQGRKIDYLKLDVEGSEWDILQNQLFDGGDVLKYVPQMTIEFHLMFPQGTLRPGAHDQRTMPEREDTERFLRMVRGLEIAGFQIFESRPDMNKYGNTQLAFIYETAWIKR